MAAAQPAASKPAPPAAGAPAAAPAMPTPPKELADHLKATGGTWKCKGQGMDNTQKMADMTGTLVVKASADNWWIQTSFDSKMGKQPFHFDSFSTYDATAKKWKQVMAETGGGWSTGESDGMKDNKFDWTLTSHLPGAAAAMMGGKTEMMFRDHQDMTDAKAGMKMSGEFSMDGKTWTQVYTMACKK
ncbi:MAG TPA: hypothetical protein VH165_08620 [Kofleriaceae bacterium]|nr:hypothetical protein [Kofleriaceae bacterium]